MVNKLIVVIFIIIFISYKGICLVVLVFDIYLIFI